jgi:hypothetical protein
MALRLDRLQAANFNSRGMQTLWQRHCEQLEANNASLQTQIDDINAALAAAAAAQAAAATADADAAAAQTTADSKAKVTRATTAPASPNTGDVWVDTAVSPRITYTWDGAAWQVAATEGADLASNVVNNTLANVTDTASRKALATNAVQTSHIQNNAVTNSVSAYTAAAITVPNTSTWTDIQSVTLTATGAVLLIQGCFYAGLFDVSYATVSSGIYQVRIVRDSTVLFGPVDFSLAELSGGMRGTGSNAYTITDQPAAGSHTFKLQAWSSGTSCAPTARSLVVTETKK